MTDRLGASREQVKEGCATVEALLKMELPMKTAAQISGTLKAASEIWPSNVMVKTLLAEFDAAFDKAMDATSKEIAQAMVEVAPEEKDAPTPLVD